MTKKSCWAFVFARGGSKGLPGKNLLPLDGKPLIAHSIETARDCPSIDRILVSTDDPDIASVARERGAEVPFLRPAELATDTASEWLAWQHALRWLAEEAGLPDVFVSLPATAPLRAVTDVERCLGRLDRETDMVITVVEAQRSPWFNMVTVDGAGLCSRVIEGHDYARRQDAPRVFDMTTIAYVSTPGFVLANSGVFDGRVKAVEIPPERAVDIDNLLDYQWAQFLVDRSGKKRDE